jgi:hypothetical protein
VSYGSLNPPPPSYCSPYRVSYGSLNFFPGRASHGIAGVRESFANRLIAKTRAGRGGARPISTGRGTRRVQLVRGEGLGVSDQYKVRGRGGARLVLRSGVAGVAMRGIWSRDGVRASAVPPGVRGSDAPPGEELRPKPEAGRSS